MSEIAPYRPDPLAGCDPASDPAPGTGPPTGPETPLVSGIVLARVPGGDDDRSPSSRPTTVPNTSLPVEPTPVPRLTLDVRSVRFEIQGWGRADIRIYRDGASQRLSNVALPHAVSVPLSDNGSPYLSVSASDHEHTDSMKCIAYAGDEVVAVNVGTRSIECTVTSSSLPTSRNG